MLMPSVSVQPQMGSPCPQRHPHPHPLLVMAQVRVIATAACRHLPCCALPQNMSCSSRQRHHLHLAYPYVYTAAQDCTSLLSHDHCKGFRTALIRLHVTAANIVLCALRGAAEYGVGSACCCCHRDLRVLHLVCCHILLPYGQTYGGR